MPLLMKTVYNSISPCLSPPLVADYHFEVKNDLILASWSFDVRSESAEFYDSVLVLFRLIKEKNIKRLFLDSGTPDGGTLTEEVIAFVEQEVFLFCPLQRVALLESIDFHWDNNIAQFINYLKVTQNLEVQFQMFTSNEAAIDWLKQDS
jgi:hypothetical protein